MRTTTRTSSQVAANVRAELARRKITQTELAHTLNLSQSAIARRLAGVVPFNVDELQVVAQSLALTPSALLSDLEGDGAC